MLTGYAGRILHVDLSAGAIEIEEPGEAFYRTYAGGSALGLYYLLKHTPRGADPLGPENTLTFALSAPTGVAVSGQSRCTTVAKSPITGGAGDAQAGGFWPAELKFAGFDAIVIRGRAAAGRAPVGHADGRRRGADQAGAGRRPGRDRRDRPGRRAAGALRGGYEHGQPRARPHRDG